MKLTHFMAGTALALVMASAPLRGYAMPAPEQPVSTDRLGMGAIILAQENGEEPLLPQEEGTEEQPAPAAPAPAAPEPEAVPQPEAAPQPEPAPEQPPAAPEPEVMPAPEAPAPAAPEPAPELPAPEPEPEVPAPAPAPEVPTPAPAPEIPAPEPTAPDVPAPAPELPAPAPEATPLAPEPAPLPVPEATEPAPAPEAPQPVPEATQPAPDGQAVEPAPADGSVAPIFDSQKRPTQPGADGITPLPEGEESQPAAPPPATDQEARPQPVEIIPLDQEEGVRVERAPDQSVRRERPKGLDVLREIGDRVIIQFGDQVSVESNDRPRMSRGARDVYYEDLPRGRTRETIIRENGVRVVTVRNEYGDVIRRSRVTPDGREYVLAYVDESEYDRLRDWRDPGLDLPPMRVDIPREEYIFTSEGDVDQEAYYEFLERPPVEKVERLYSIDEVKRSARIRDKTRRIDLDTLKFAFGSADIPEAEVQRLANVASAMEQILTANPAETFLIEGHTDAVGSDLANLALSDRRAEAVAQALTNVFAIPPENLATQGYGEQYLKVRSQEPEQENRRVAIRRITPLVAPIASAQ